MKNTKSSLLIILLLLNVALIHAHALVIDTKKSGEIGEKHEVRVYYSEFKDGTVEKVAGWYSNVPDFQLWLVKPDGERIQLKTSGKNDHYLANFTPEEEGAYRLEISHMAEDPGEGTAYQFNAFAQILVGNSVEILPVTTSSPELILLEDPENRERNIKNFKTYFKGNLEEGITVTAFYPSGLTGEVKSDSEGKIQLNFSEKGDYFLEATIFNENESGKTQKTTYSSVWRVATQKLVIK